MQEMGMGDMGMGDMGMGDVGMGDVGMGDMGMGDMGMGDTDLIRVWGLEHECPLKQFRPGMERDALSHPASGWTPAFGTVITACRRRGWWCPGGWSCRCGGAVGGGAVRCRRWGDVV